MAEIKTQLGEQAEADRLKVAGAPPALQQAAPGPSSSLLGQVFAEFAIGTAQARVIRQDTKLTLQPGEGVEVKMNDHRLPGATWTQEGKPSLIRSVARGSARRTSADTSRAS
jgi:hypothetical protein